jgi:hypothetical protein
MKYANNDNDGLHRSAVQTSAGNLSVLRCRFYAKRAALDQGKASVVLY